MLHHKRLVLAHFWLAFGSFGLALLLGAWQMWVRSPLHPWIDDPEHYYRSVTAHGTTMGYVFPTLVAMAFGYAVTDTSNEPVVHCFGSRTVSACSPLSCPLYDATCG